MKDTTRRYRRGDTSPERPGKVFWAYNHGNEQWTTPSEAKKRIVKHNEAMSRWLSKPGSLEVKRKCYRDWVVTPEGRIKRRAIAARFLKTINGMLINRIRSRIAVALKKGGTKSASTLALIGCTIPKFRAHLEKQFEQGMTWENAGSWEIDHRVPLAAFNLADPEQQKLAFSFHNCKPMWREANRIKGDKIEGELFAGRQFRRSNIIPFQKVA